MKVLAKYCEFGGIDAIPFDPALKGSTAYDYVQSPGRREKLMECIMCGDDNGPHIEHLCGLCYCVDCAIENGVRALVHEDRREGVKCSNCQGLLSDEVLEDYFTQTGEQGYRDLQGRNAAAAAAGGGGGGAAVAVSDSARIRNAWGLLFHCPVCATPNGYGGDGCDVLRCVGCHTNFNPVTGEQAHTFHLSKLHQLLSRVTERDISNQIQWALRQPDTAQAAAACHFTELQEAVDNGEHVEASSHILGIGGSPGFAAHIVALATRPPRRRHPPQPVLVAAASGGGGGGGSMVPPRAAAAAAEARPPPPPPEPPVTEGIAMAAPEGWRCKFCETYNTSRIKCAGCPKTRWESR